MHFFQQLHVFTTSFSLLKSTGVVSNLPILIYQLLILSLLNQPFQQTSMYQHLLRFINLFLLHNQINLIQLLHLPHRKIFTRLYYVLFINPTVYRIFSLLIFNYKLFLTSFLQFFYVKHSNNLSTIKLTNKICPQHSIFNFFNHKNFFRPIRSVTFCKSFLHF